MMRQGALYATILLLLAGCATPNPNTNDPLEEQDVVNGGSKGGGGSVRNAAPSILAWTGSLTTADNSGASVQVMTVRVLDPNGESDLETLRIDISGPTTLTADHALTRDETSRASEPASFGADGFKVWAGDNNRDGILEVRFQYVIPVGTPAGTLQFQLTATDDDGETATSAAWDTIVEVFSEITIAADPILADGTPDTGNAWGRWSATPGSSNVDSLNYLRIENTGQDATATLVIDYTEDAFVGADDGNFSIPIDANMVLSWWEGGPRAVPSDGTFTFGSPSTDGSTAVQFSALENVIFVTYRLESLPAVLPEQSYEATYTATEI